MTKQQFKEQQRQKRIAANGGFGLKLAKIMLGEVAWICKYDNSAIWALRNSIAEEIAPIIRKRQLAWING